MPFPTIFYFTKLKSLYRVEKTYAPYFSGQELENYITGLANKKQS